MENLRHGSEDFELQKLCEKLAIEELQHERDQVHENAREDILKIQMENKKTYVKNIFGFKVQKTTYMFNF